MMLLVDPIEEGKWQDDGSGPYSGFDFKCWMISLTTVSLLWFGMSPSLPPRCEKASLMVFNDRLTSLMNMDYSIGYNNRLYTEYWHFWKTSDRFCQRHNFRVALLFSGLFLASSFSLLFSSTSLHCANLEVVMYITEPESGFFLVVSLFTNLSFFWCSISIYHLLVSWTSMRVCLITASYAETRRKIFPDDCWLLCSRRTNTALLVLMSYTSIYATVQHDISFISSALDPEGTWMEAGHVWVFVVKSGGLKGGRFFLQSFPL